jgi:hypothetical protein
MQISRHWRMNSQRYRLHGVRYQNGEVSLQARHVPPSGQPARTQEVQAQAVPVAAFTAVGR